MNDTPRPAPPRALKVLVAEDNIINQRLIVGMLSKLGHTGVLVSDGAKALRCLAQLKFDLVLMDVMMPNMDGLQALQSIRASEQGQGGHLPVIMVTSHNEADDAARFRSAGADGYLTKPLDIDALNAHLTQILQSP